MSPRAGEWGYFGGQGWRDVRGYPSGPAMIGPGPLRPTAPSDATALKAGRRTSATVVGRCIPRTVKLKLDVHDVYNRGDEIDRALRAVIDEAVLKKATLVEIIPGKGSGQLKKRVLRFLDRKEVKVLYDRVEKDSDNFGRVFVHFRWRKAGR